MEHPPVGCSAVVTLKFKHSLGHFRLKAQLYAAGVKAMYLHISILTA